MTGGGPAAPPWCRPFARRQRAAAAQRTRSALTAEQLQHSQPAIHGRRRQRHPAAAGSPGNRQTGRRNAPIPSALHDMQKIHRYMGPSCTGRSATTTLVFICILHQTAGAFEAPTQVSCKCFHISTPPCRRHVASKRHGLSWSTGPPSVLGEGPSAAHRRSKPAHAPCTAHNAAYARYRGYLESECETGHTAVSCGTAGQPDRLNGRTDGGGGGDDE